MPLSSSALSALIIAKAGSSLIAGSKMTPYIRAIADATVQHLMTASTVTSVNMVTGPGSGTLTGRITGVNRLTMRSLIMNRLRLYRLAGRDTQRLVDAICFGVVQSLNTVVVQGTVIGGGPGSGTGRIVGLSPTIMEKLILAYLGPRVLIGEKQRQFISSVAFGVCTAIMSNAVVNTICIGVFSPPPAGPVPIPTAPGTGRFA